VRIVADTNTVASGLIWQGPPRRIIDAARAGTVTLHTSVTLLAELAEIAYFTPSRATVSRDAGPAFHLMSGHRFTHAGPVRQRGFH
jgi:predicted nucleic acid-binding protein